MAMDGKYTHSQRKHSCKNSRARDKLTSTKQATPAKKSGTSLSSLSRDGLVWRKVAAVKSQSAWRHIKVVDTKSRRQREHSVDVIESVTKQPLPEIAHAQSGKITLTGGERTVLA